MAKFSKQHYTAIAQTLKSTGLALVTTASPEAIPVVLHVFQVVQSRLTDMLIRDNPSFDPERFKNAVDLNSR